MPLGEEAKASPRQEEMNARIQGGRCWWRGCSSPRVCMPRAIRPRVGVPSTASSTRPRPRPGRWTRPSPSTPSRPSGRSPYELLPVRFIHRPGWTASPPARLNIQSALPKPYHGFVKAASACTPPHRGALLRPDLPAEERLRHPPQALQQQRRHRRCGSERLHSFNSAEGFAKAFLDDHEVSGTALYDQRRIGHYGYPSNDSIQDVLDAIDSPDDFRKDYNDIGFATRVRTLHPDSGRLGYTAGMECTSTATSPKAVRPTCAWLVMCTCSRAARPCTAWACCWTTTPTGASSAPTWATPAEQDAGGPGAAGEHRGEIRGAYRGRIFLDAPGSPPSTSSRRPTRATAPSTISWCRTPGVDGERRRNSFRSPHPGNPG